jgi:hypothetical protein
MSTIHIISLIQIFNETFAWYSVSKDGELKMVSRLWGQGHVGITLIFFWEQRPEPFNGYLTSSPQPVDDEMCRYSVSSG